MYNVRNVKHLTQTLDTTKNQLDDIINDSDRFYEKLLLIDPSKKKEREVINVKGSMRSLQSKLYRRLLLPKIVPSKFSHGGIRGRDIKSNVLPHKNSSFILKADISNFYPSIHHSRVYRLFTEKFNCSPDVARYCTRICTYDNHLALGLITSPILADQTLENIDARLGAICNSAGLAYTRYVDDVTISGPFNLKYSGFENIVSEIIAKDGFQSNAEKYIFSELSKNTSITNIRVINGKLDARKEYIEEIKRQLADAERLSNREPFEGPYYTKNQILGRIQFVSWVNPRRKKILHKIYTGISWNDVELMAKEKGLVALKKILKKKPDQVQLHN